MTDFWRRQAIQSERMRGMVHRRGDDFFGEVSAGRIVDSAVFECGPCSGRSTNEIRPIRLRVQARDDVVIRTRRRREPSGQIQDLRWPGYIALGASGGHEDQAYLWVQIVSADAEEIVELDGSTRVEDILQHAEPSFGGPDNSFAWAGRRWSIDNNQLESARYPLARPTLGSPNCETIYDAPSSSIAIRGYLRDHLATARVTKLTRFHSFIYQLPILPNERRAVRLPRLSPTASVAWSFDESYGRTEAGGEVRELQRRYRVHYIHPNGIAPLGMVHVLWRVFLGR
jgi:hypothetical protein